jgi:DNA segregation ATPase FtsK/SpoIIIE, S-DNA-T family
VARENETAKKTTVRGADRSAAPGTRSEAARSQSARSSGSSARRGARAVSAGRPSKTAGGGRAATGRQGAGRHPERAREIVVLVLFAVAVFLIFCLGATDKAGVMGRGIEAGLVYVFGKLAFLVPVGLIAVGVTTVFSYRLRRSLRFLGVVVFLVGLFLLMGGGVPPFGHHGAELFTRAEFEGKAGALGETLYAGVHGLLGIVGVGIVGWVLELAGFSLVTGITARWLGGQTRSAAKAVKSTAERTAVLNRQRDGEFDFEPAEWPAHAPREPRPAGGDARSGGGFDDPFAIVNSGQIGPVDLVGDSASTIATTRVTSGPVVFGDAFDDWASGRQGTPSPDDCRTEVARGPKSLVDGARAFADLFTDGAAAASIVSAVQVQPVADARGTPAAGAAVAHGGAAGAAPGPAAHAEAAHPAAEFDDDTDEEPAVDEQEALPGLERKARQIELALEEPAYILPQSDVLRKSTPQALTSGAADRDTSAVLIQALGQFGVQARVIGMVVGPRVTRYELHLAPGTKVSKVSSLKDDLAYALATTEIRILAPIPGKSAVGVEVPNSRPDFVTLGDIYRDFPKSAGPLMVWLGKDISGKAVYADLTRLPHLLIAGTTGSGKSGCVNCLVSSVLLRSTPEQVRMIMIDPKKVELSHYDRIPHLLVPVVTNMKDAAGVLHNVVKEMEDRYELMELDHARNLEEMNKTRARRGERPVPYIMIVVDELADLMMTSPQEVEDYVIRLAQKSRAVGIHLIVATQRPSADVITGMIKANIPSRIAFAVSSQTDSRVILDVNGAEALLGQGDMLFKPLGSSVLQRVQGAYITEEEIAVLVNHWRHQAEPQFRDELLRRPVEAKKGERADDEFDPDSDDLLSDAAMLVIETGSASVSMLQRRLRVGYTRAGRLIDMLERRGIVGPWEGSKPRQILVETDDVEQVMAALKAEGRVADEEDDS